MAVNFDGIAINVPNTDTSAQGSRSDRIALSDGPHILYLVHDLSDAAVRRRITMLEAGGGRVTLAGFRRTAATVTRVGDVPAIDLGRTEDGAFWKRMLTVARTARRLSGMLGSAPPDIILARNLEMLALVNFVPAQGCPRPRLVYESLDIHRLLLRKDPVGAALRGLERKLLRRASLIITSSPAFVREYFLRVQKVPQPIVLVENKVVELDGHQQFCIIRAGAGASFRAAAPDRLVRRVAVSKVPASARGVFANDARALRDSSSRAPRLSRA